MARRPQFREPMTSPSALPFELPVVSPGFAALGEGARVAGMRALAAVSAALAPHLGGAVRIGARPLPGCPSATAGTARLGIDLPALPSSAVVEIEAALIARVVDRLAGGAGEVAGALSLTPIESAAFELLGLIAVDALRGDEAIESALMPRLGAPSLAPEAALVVELTLDLGGLRGRGRLLLPAPAVRAFHSAGPLPGALPAATVCASLRRGHARVSDEDLELLSAGDVLVLDAEPEPEAVLAFPNGPRVRGHLEQETLKVKEIVMSPPDSFPVTVEVELARVQVTLGELSRLAPGEALPLALGRRGTVTLRVGDKAIAVGELVDIDGQVGVRVLRLGE